MTPSAARLAIGYAGLALAWIGVRALLFGGVLAGSTVLLLADALFFAASALGLYLALRARDQARSLLDDQLRLATDMTEAYYWEIDADLRFTALRGAILEQRGMNVLDALGKPSKALANFSLLDITTEEFARMRADRQPYRNVRASTRLPGDDTRYVSINGDPVFDAAGMFTGYRGITREITAQVRAELALQESERRFRRMVETAPNLLFFITNPSRDRWTYRSPNWGTIWNYPKAPPASGRVAAVLDRILPEDRARYDGRAQAEARGEVVDIEYRFLDPDRGIRWLRTRSIGVPGEDGEVEVYGVTEDVTERHAVLDRISASESLHRSVLEGMAEGVIVRDATGRVTAANRAAERILDREPGSMITTMSMNTNGIALREDDTPFPVEEFPWRQVMATGQPVLGSVMGTRRRDGSLVWVRINAVPLRPVNGVAEGVVATFQDISIERAALAALSQSTATLERRVAERTEALQKTNRELETFAHSVSHDLRAPLRTINGFARLLADREGTRLDSESRRLLSRIEAGAGRMGELIDDVIEYSSATRREPEFAQVDLDRIAERVLGRHAQAYPATLLEVGPLGKIYGDARMLERVLDALIGNALKFSARAGKPHVRLWSDSQAGDKTVHVADNGAGFDMAHSGHLFALFRRLHHDHEFPGTGVGLATVKNLIERLGGTVTAQGVPDNGATFSFRLRESAP